MLNNLHEPILLKHNVVRSFPWEDLLMSDIDGEVWKDVYAYEGMYQVSNKGRIKSLLSDRILKQWFGGNNQRMVTLCCDGIKNKIYVSNIVGGCFLGFCKENEVYCHLDSNKCNNMVENLSIETKSSQMLLSAHNGVLKDWGIRYAGINTRFVSKNKYVGTYKNGEKFVYSHNELLLKYGTGVRSIFRCLQGKESFKTAYKQTWEKLPI